MDDLKKLYDKSEKLRKMQVRFLPNKILFSEGELSFEMYILLSGKVEILKKDKRIAVVEEEGSYLGELSTLLGIPRTATVKTLSSCEFIAVKGDKVIDFFASSPPLGLKLARMLADRLAKMNEENVKLEEKIDLLTRELKEVREKSRKSEREIKRLVKQVEKIGRLRP
ncbi:MAG: cyclic nucleotide-binding domain-containing protein [Candidatus Hydrogenedentota bacterium]|nr:MAG: cyclic nucleotide-binding domain-containing protein [Candidatus Hydrogenedentota bacterium]